MTSLNSSYFARERPELIRVWQGPLGRVLDIGCGAGVLGAALLENGAATWVLGVEAFGPAAEVARARYDDVIFGDVEQILPKIKTAAGQVDTVIFADVLEHLVDPWTVLSEIVAVLKSNGRVLISLPNVTSVEVVAPLLIGRFDYRDSGILDRTHLRFFTRSSAELMLRSAGLDIVALHRTYPDRGRVFGHHPFALLGNRGARQFIFSCRKP